MIRDRQQTLDFSFLLILLNWEQKARRLNIVLNGRHTTVNISPVSMCGGETTVTIIFLNR